MDESETLELLGMYMDLSEKQEEVIGQLAGIVRRQAERIREMESVGGSGAVTGWVNVSDIGGSTTSSSSSSGKSSSSSSSSKSFKAGDKVTLSKTPLYASSTASSKSGTKSGTFYIWDATIKSNRIRITNSKRNVGKDGQVTGWVNVSDL